MTFHAVLIPKRILKIAATGFFLLLVFFQYGLTENILAHEIPKQKDSKIRVVASFSILGDLVSQIAKNRVELTVLVGPNADAHVYEPTTGDAKALRNAQILVRNGLHFEGWMDRLITSSQFKGEISTVSDGIAPLYGKASYSAAFSIDPHAWQAVANMKVYAKNFLSTLLFVDPIHQSEYCQAESLYQANLSRLETDIITGLSRIPSSSRIIITSHDAFQYFGKAYNIEFIAPNGWSTESNPSAKTVSEVIKQIKATKCRALFVENIADPRLMEGIAQETNLALGGKIFSDALSSQGQGAETYEKMMRHNLSAFAKALSQNP